MINGVTRFCSSPQNFMETRSSGSNTNGRNEDEKQEGCALSNVINHNPIPFYLIDKCIELKEKK